MRALTSLVFAFGLTACAALPPEELPAESIAVPAPDAEGIADRLVLERYVRGVFVRLAIANADLCGDNTMAEFGMRFATLASIEEESRAAAAASGLLTDDPVVFFADPELPAGKAGVRLGDRLAAIEGRVLEPGELPRSQFSSTVAQALLRRGSVRFTMEREGRLIEADIAPVLSCAVNVYLDTMPLPNAFTNGEDVLLLAGIMTIARTERELAVVIGHELAHVLFKAARGGRWTDSIEAEIEADRLGLYLAARAGYDVSGTSQILVRLAAFYPELAEGSDSHPSSQERVIRMIQTEREIAARRAAGLPLLPADADPTGSAS